MHEERETNDEQRDPPPKATPQGQTLIDCHVHLAALPDGDKPLVLVAPSTSQSVLTSVRN